jgi:hypothetical protein
VPENFLAVSCGDSTAPRQKQLESMKKEFCERVNQAWGGNLVREVKFIAKPGPKRVSREMDNEHIPFIRSRKGS